MTKNILKHITAKALCVMLTTAAVLSALPVFGSAADREIYTREIESTVVVENAGSFSNLGKYSDCYNLIVRDSTLTDEIDLTKTEFGNITFENCKIESEEIYISDFVYKIAFKNTDFEDFSDCFDNLKNDENLEFEFINRNCDDLYFLSDFDELYTLSFTDCQLNSINGIGEMANLHQLYLFNTGVEKIDEIRAAKKLTTFYIDGSYISDLSPLENNTVIDSIGILNSPLITDLSALKTMPNLEYFYSQNMEMALTKDILDYLNNNGIYNDFTDESLKVKQNVIRLADRVISDSMTDREKVKAITDYLVNNLVYDFEALENDKLCEKYNQYALKNALNGLGVCVNYAYLTQAVLNLKGVKTYNVLSYGHIFNLVSIEGDYLWLDVTFLTDNTEEQMKYNFLVDDENFEELHHEFWAIPASVYRFRNAENGTDGTNWNERLQNGGDNGSNSDDGETTTKLTAKKESDNSYEASFTAADSVPDFYLTVFVVSAAAALILLAAAVIIVKTNKKTDMENI